MEENYDDDDDNDDEENRGRGWHEVEATTEKGSFK